MMRNVIIGVDNGYGFTKTVHSSFVSSLIQTDSEPTFKDKVIRYNNKWYYVGSEPDDIVNDKTEDEKVYILTLIAIAEELKLKGITEAHIYLSAGLPLSKFGVQKDSFKNYLGQNRRVCFEYEEVVYNIEIDENIILSPQGYSALIPMIDDFDNDIVLVDIGTWTIDILPIIDKVPNQSQSDSLNEGVKTCIDEINRELRSVFGNGITTKQIQSVMLNKESGLPIKYLEIVKKHIREYAKHIVSMLATRFNLDTTSFVFVGGGANIINNFGIDLIENGVVIGDINVNAVGYEYIANVTIGDFN